MEKIKFLLNEISLFITAIKMQRVVKVIISMELQIIKQYLKKYYYLDIVKNHKYDHISDKWLNHKLNYISNPHNLEDSEILTKLNQEIFLIIDQLHTSVNNIDDEINDELNKIDMIHKNYKCNYFKNKELNICNVQNCSGYMYDCPGLNKHKEEKKNE